MHRHKLGHSVSKNVLVLRLLPFICSLREESRYQVSMKRSLCFILVYREPVKLSPVKTIASEFQRVDGGHIAPSVDTR